MKHHMFPVLFLGVLVSGTAPDIPGSTALGGGSAEERAITSIVEAFELSAAEYQDRATVAFLDDMSGTYGITVDRMAGGMEKIGLPGPMAYFQADVFPIGEPMHNETIYFFQTAAFGLFFVRLGAPDGIKVGPWSVSEVFDPSGMSDPCALKIHLQGAAFHATFDFDPCLPLDPMHDDYFCQQLRGTVTLVPDC
ncbi:MAG: hypothetical protein CMJ89_04400 [Planctomycetes bacterium]|jgi:hypothetical protein|nr:hypothetical protein [Planctomycetota bacterium]